MLTANNFFSSYIKCTLIALVHNNQYLFFNRNFWEPNHINRLVIIGHPLSFLFRSVEFVTLNAAKIIDME